LHSLYDTHNAGMTGSAGRGMVRKSKTKTQRAKSRTKAKHSSKPQSNSAQEASEVPDALPTEVSPPLRIVQVEARRSTPPMMRNRHIALKQCRHGSFMYNLNDRMIGVALDYYGEWCEGELALLAPLLRPGRVVVDVGAYIGTHTVFFAKKVAPSGHVYAIEPQRHPFQMLCGNVALNALTNVTCIPGMAAAEAGERRITLHSPMVAQNFGGNRALPVPKGEKVPVIRIDDLDPPRCDLIKIDVEGMESDVLAGARRTIERFRPVVFCENNSVSNSVATIKAVQDIGYRSWWHISSYFNPDNFFKEKKNIFTQCLPEANMLCTPPEAKIVIEGLTAVEGPDDNWKKAFDRMRALTGTSTEAG
jgi:FkbM family methyltransferase